MFHNILMTSLTTPLARSDEVSNYTLWDESESLLSFTFMGYTQYFTVLIIHLSVVLEICIYSYTILRATRCVIAEQARSFALMYINFLAVL